MGGHYDLIITCICIGVGFLLGWAAGSLYGWFGYIAGFLGGLFGSIAFFKILSRLPKAPTHVVNEKISRERQEEDEKIRRIRRWHAERMADKVITSDGVDMKKKYAVIHMYNEDHIPSSDPGFPTIDEDYLYGRCFPVVSEKPGEVILEYKDRQIRVFQDRTISIAYPGLYIGQDVETVPPRTYRAGKVAEISWHFKYKATMFFLEINGKILKKRYFGYELRMRRETLISNP